MKYSTDDEMDAICLELKEVPWNTNWVRAKSGETFLIVEKNILKNVGSRPHWGRMYETWTVHSPTIKSLLQREIGKRIVWKEHRTL